MIINLFRFTAAGGGPNVTAGLVAWWKMDENSGTVASDSSLNGNDASFTGTGLTWVAPGKIGTSMINFGGAGYLSAPYSFSLDPRSITLSAWVRISSFANSVNTVISAVGPGGDGYHQFSVNSNGTLAVYFRAGGIPIYYDGTGTITLTTNTWYFICVSYDASTGLVSRVNDVVDKTVSNSGSLDFLGGSPATSIGQDLNTPSRFWNGDIDDARVYNRALTSLEATALYNYF